VRFKFDGFIAHLPTTFVSLREIILNLLKVCSYFVGFWRDSFAVDCSKWSNFDDYGSPEAFI
jgi:uncharacterized membrane protein